MLQVQLQGMELEHLPLYQTPANKLDAWIQHYLQPNEQFNGQVRDATDRIATFLKNNCFQGQTTKVHKVVKGGSSGKGTTLKNGSDADLVVFLSCFKNLQDQYKERGDVVNEIREKLNLCRRSIANEIEIPEPRVNYDPQGRLRQPRSLSFTIRSRKKNEAIEVDVLPAFDILGQVTDTKPDPSIYITLIEARGDPGDFSPCFTELQRNFVMHRPTKLKSLIRLMKHWYKEYVKSKHKDKQLPHKYALELLTIYAWEQGSGKVDFCTEEGFCTVLQLLCQYQKLCIHWTENYDFQNQTVGDCIKEQLRKTRPVILDPADPTGGVGQGARWDLVAAEAQVCLQWACCKNSLGPVRPWDVKPATLVQLSVRSISGSILPMTVNPYVTVLQIKEEIQRQWNIPTNQQRLCLQGMEPSPEVLQNWQTLADYGVFYNTTINLLIITPQEIQIFVRNIDGKIYTYQVRPNITVMELKQKIKEHLKVAVAQQRLTYSSRELEDHNTLAYYQIKSESTLSLLLRLRGGAIIQQENGTHSE